MTMRNIYNDYQLASHIIAAGNRALKYLEDYNFEQFENDVFTFDAITRNLKIISEAVNHLTDNYKGKYIKVNWVILVELRNLLAYESVGINARKLYDILRNDLPDALEI